MKAWAIKGLDGEIDLWSISPFNRSIDSKQLRAGYHCVPVEVIEAGERVATWHGININEIVRYKLTDKGRAIHKQKHEELAQFIAGRGGKPHEYAAPKVDADGWSTTQLWCLFSDYGEHIQIGSNQPFDTEIQVQITTPLPSPSGCVSVPVEPTQAMCIAGQDKAREWPKFPLRIVPIYKAMLEATKGEK